MWSIEGLPKYSNLGVNRLKSWVTWCLQVPHRKLIQEPTLCHLPRQSPGWRQTERVCGKFSELREAMVRLHRVLQKRRKQTQDSTVNTNLGIEVNNCQSLIIQKVCLWNSIFKIWLLLLLWIQILPFFPYIILIDYIYISSLAAGHIWMWNLGWSVQFSQFQC